MQNAPKIVKFSLMLLTVVIAVLLIALVTNLINVEEARSSGGRAILIIGILALTFIAITALVAGGNQKDS